MLFFPRIGKNYIQQALDCNHITNTEPSVYHTSILILRLRRCFQIQRLLAVLPLPKPDLPFNQASRTNRKHRVSMHNYLTPSYADKKALLYNFSLSPLTQTMPQCLKMSYCLNICRKWMARTDKVSQVMCRGAERK